MTVKYFKFLLPLLFLSVLNVFAETNTAARTEKYKTRYGVECLSEKIVDNHGNGFENLYGCRNVRTVLFGAVYRGGANNFYHRTNKRDNHNPLPPDGLKHLADEGFSTAVYLYKKNFDSADTVIISDDGTDTLRYLDNDLSSDKKLHHILKMVRKVLEDPSRGPIYIHCWNGWHQSGYLSAIILRQFCGYSADKAIAYWVENTDGVKIDNEKIMDKIRKFEPYEDLIPSPEKQAEVCPSCLVKESNQ